MKRLLILLLLAGALAFALTQWRRTHGGGKTPALMVYCAAGLKKPVEAIAEQYRQETGQEIFLQFGGTGTLLSQLRIAKKGDLFLAADESSMADAQKLGVIRNTFALVVQHPVIAVAKGNPHHITSVDDLLKPEIKLALPDAAAASIGKVCKKILADRWVKLAAKAAVTKPTVTEIAADVQLGAADAALVWDSVIPLFEGTEAVTTPELSAHKEKAVASVLSFGKQLEASLHFAHYLIAPDQGGAVFAKFGFQPAAAAK